MYVCLCVDLTTVLSASAVSFSYVCRFSNWLVCFTPPAAVCCTGADNQRDLGDEGEQAEEHCQLFGQLPGRGHRAMGT